MAEHVIIGAGVTGASAALALREHAPRDRVTLIGAEDTPPYERPPLSKGYLRGSTTAERLLVRPAAFYAGQRIETILGTAAARVDPARRVVHLSDGRRLPFDSLLIATGARNRRAVIPGSGLDGVLSLRTIADADRLRARLATTRRAVVVGMGFIGCEVAASLRHEGLAVTAVDPGPAPLARILGGTVARTLASLHQMYGVRAIFNDGVAAIEGRTRVESIVTREGLRVACDLVVVGIGVEPAVDVLAGSGIALDNGVAVDEYCATNLPGIYAAGDVANHYHPVFKRRIRVEHLQNAQRQGVVAARNMLGHRVPYDEVPWFWSDQYDANIQYAGHHTSCDELVVRGRLDEGSYAAFYTTGGVIDAVVGVNNAREVRRAMPLIKARRAVDLDRLRDKTVDLRTLTAT